MPNNNNNNNSIQSDIDSLNDMIYPVYLDRIERGFSHEEAMAGAMAYDRILRGDGREAEAG